MFNLICRLVILIILELFSFAIIADSIETDTIADPENQDEEGRYNYIRDYSLPYYKDRCINIDLTKDNFLITKQQEKINVNDNLFTSSNSSLIKYNKARVIVLNKVIAKRDKVILELNQLKFFANLSIEISQCIKNTDPYDSYNLMWINVLEYIVNDHPKIVFSGWITSKYLSLSTVEHPVYEIIPVDCM